MVIEGGVLTDLKGLNRKGGGLAARTLTDKDISDLRTALAAEVDYISLSFVKDAQDIRQTRSLIARLSPRENTNYRENRADRSIELFDGNYSRSRCYYGRTWRPGGGSWCS